MKPIDKKEKSDCSASDDSPPQRPKRNTCQKTGGVTNGLLWREETDLKKALYASLQENKKKNWEEDGEENLDDEVPNTTPAVIMENGEEESPKKAKVHAQRKFAQGSTPSSPVLTPQKLPPVNNSSTQLLPYRRPKTEDFLTFLCLRGTSILPPSLDFLNSCSKSDTSSECRSLSPELDEYSSKELNFKNNDGRERNNLKHDSVENGLPRKVGACKASSKRYVDTSISVKKNLSNSKINREAIVSKKRKIRDENEDPSRLRVSSSAKSKSSGLNALREKYKKQRLAADKKKLIPTKPSNTSSSKKVIPPQKTQNNAKTLVLSPKNVSNKKLVRPSSSSIQKTKLSKLQKKLAVEKRKSLRSADVRPKRLVALKKKTPWIRRAKLVPPIVDVESDSSEPEIIHTTPVKKVASSSSSQKNTDKSEKVCDRLRSKKESTKTKSRLTPRQMLLRKHMQNRLKSKNSVLLSKSIKSRTIAKRTAKQVILKKAKKNLVMKTMSLRKDLQNKRVTRSAKHQIEEMLWSNPEKRSKNVNQKPAVSSVTEKKKRSNENLSSSGKKSKPTVLTKGKDVVKNKKVSKDTLKRKLHSPVPNDNKVSKKSGSPKLSETSSCPPKISRRSLSREEKPSPSTSKSHNSHQKSNAESEYSRSEEKIKSTKQNESKKILAPSNNENDQSLIPSVSSQQTSTPVITAKTSKTPESLKTSSENELNKGSQKSHQESDNKTDVKEKVKIENSNILTSGCSGDKNVQNNLNLVIPEKSSNKDISKLMELNVSIEETIYPTSDPCCSTSIAVKDKTVNKVKDSKSDSVKEVNVIHDNIIPSKNFDKKSLKKSSNKEENKPLKQSIEKEKLNKKEKPNIKSPKKHDSGERRSSKDNDVNNESKKNSHKKDTGKTKHENEYSEVKKVKNHDKKNNCKTEKSIYSENHDMKNIVKLDNKDSKEKSPPKNINPSFENNLPFLQTNLSPKVTLSCTDAEKLNDDVFAVRNMCNEVKLYVDIGKKVDFDSPKPCCSKDQPRNLKNSSSSSTTNRETDDDSDYDLTLDQFIKLQALKAAEKSNSELASSSKTDNNSKKTGNESKDFIITCKDVNKDVDKKSKKDGESSKHKKDKDSSKFKNHDKEQKTPKKEDKLSKKDPKALAKLLKKEREKEKSKARKEEKSKHKKDGSSSSKSKKDNDKDGSKSSKREADNSAAKLNLVDSSVEHSESKKDKIKKESKLSRSSSCDETKSPKKKKKHNEFKDLEKIKNLISKSSILSELSGFKEFKRKSSFDKSELKKSKKKKKLALLKEKKLSKKLSSKLLRKYSKKKGLKSKKKLKKKELKEMKIADLESKILSKTKKQKHKFKGDHHGKDSIDKVKNIEASVSLTTSKTINITSTLETANLIAKSSESFSASSSNLSSVTNISQSCSSSSTSTVPTYIIESIPDVIPPIENMSNHIPQPMGAPTEQFVFSSADDLQSIVASDFTGVFEDTFPTGAILLATRDTISQVPVHFIQDIPAPKTMADAATNTGEDDLEETVDVVESLKSDEMSVGTQTITPVASPIPTVEIQPLVLPKNYNLPPKEKEKNETDYSTSAVSPTKTIPPVISSDIKTTVSPSITPVKATPIENNTIKPSLSSNTPVKAAPVAPAPTGASLPESSSVKSTSPFVTPTKPNISNDTASASPKTKRRSSFVKKCKTQSILLPEGQPFPLDSAKMVSAPVYHPTVDEFRDPLEYIFKIQEEASQFGICKIVPPPSFKPECKVNDDMRFTAHNQYLHKMLRRWGPNVQHTACIRKHLKSQKVKLEQAPLIGGIELDISRFYHTVQQYGGLQQVIEKKKWQRVADTLRVPKTAQDRVTKLYDAYCKYLVSYDTLPKEEKEKLEKEVMSEHEKNVKLRNSAKDLEKDDEDFDDEENVDCVSKGRSMSLSNFFRIARNIMNMWYKNAPSPDEVEHEYWKIVTEGHQHVVVHAGNIDSSVYHSGFACNRNSPFAKHPWNLKILTNNSNSILRCMGPVSGVTIPTLHVGMLFTTGCWYRDPHCLPWIEYLHTGASKIWYSIPAKGCEKFRESMKKIMPEYCTNNPIWLPSDTAMVPPELLVKNGASLSRTIQNSGQFIVIFPESFTSTICCGYCVSESVYFAPSSWLDLALKAFKDIQSSCEPPSFSLERLLFSIANDPKTQPETLQKILPMIQNVRLKDMHMRAQLSELGLKNWERLPIVDVKEKKKKIKIDDESEHECEICRTHCYVSMVAHVLDETIYCLPHALEHIPKKNLKLCKLKYMYDEKELKDLEAKIEENITLHLAKLSKKKSPKKKLTPAPENIFKVPNIIDKIRDCYWESE